MSLEGLAVVNAARGQPRRAVRLLAAAGSLREVISSGLTPAERYDGTPFTARGFERVPALDHLQGWLASLMTM